ncbi:acyltransferase domain-containing protein [Aspergillus undulatus]|uniref:acyltransferase domain-containing protein n=1 Tax=Aspergillus undulatus TaxID=1810928 RepID=UPI003CCD7F71
MAAIASVALPNSPKPLLSRSSNSSTPGSHRSQSVGRCRLFLLSAPDESSLRNRIRLLQSYLQGEEKDFDDEWMNNLAYTLNEHRPAQIYRAVVTANSASQLIDRLSPLKIKSASTKQSVGFVFTGQGAEWPGMGKELLQTYPVFRQSMEQFESHMRKLGAPYNVIDEILKPIDTSKLTHPLLSQPIVTGLQIALVNLLNSWEIYPDAVTGHSSGEIAAAYAAGVISMEDALTVAYFRGVTASALIEKGTKGAMMAVGLSAADAQAQIATLRTGKASVGCINGPTSVTVSGDETAISELETILVDKEIFTRRLDVEVAYHSHHMDRIAADYLGSIAHTKPLIPGDPERTKFFSSVTGRQMFPVELDPQYWVQNLVGPVDMVSGIQSMCFENNDTMPNGPLARKQRRPIMPRKITVDSLIEIGPHAALAGPIKQTLKASNISDRALPEYDSVLIKGMDATSTALAVPSSLVCRGYPVNFQAVNDPSDCYEQQVLGDVPN